MYLVEFQNLQLEIKTKYKKKFCKQNINKSDLEFERLKRKITVFKLTADSINVVSSLEKGPKNLKFLHMTTRYCI